jgi:uncharacterized protein HemX
MPDKDDNELDEEQDETEETAEEEQEPAPKRARGPAARKRTTDDEAEEDEDVLPDAVMPPARGGSGALVAIIVIVIVAVLVAGVWWQQEAARDKARQDKQARLAVAASQLSTIQSRVDRALSELDQPEPNVERAIETLNDASENISVLAQGTSQVEGGPDFSTKLSDYEAAVKSAREKLKLSTTRSVRSVANKIGDLVSAYSGDVGTPIGSPTPRAGEAQEEAETATPEPTDQGEAAPETEASEG